MHESRLEWAHRAHRRFLAGLDERTRSCFADHDGEASVVLFGRTQVGKTTLLLHLLGVDPAHTSDVSTLLRGGRASGQSATSTAMQYQRSPDHNWRLVIDGAERVLTVDALVDELADIRRAVETGCFDARDPVTVFIPGHLFASGENAGPGVRILDLPGDNPRDAAEAAHVRQIAERYVPHADLILIVGKADDLSFLNPRSFQLPGIRDWRFTPTRFRIITTYSFSLQSLVDWATRQSALDAGTFRTRLMEQLGTHAITLSADARDPRLYFPLEFGDSWDGMQRDDSVLYAKMNPVVAQLMDELRDDIANAAQPHGRIRQAAYAHIVAARIKEETLAGMIEHLDILEETHTHAAAATSELLKLHDKACAEHSAAAACVDIKAEAVALRRQAASEINVETDGVDRLGTNTKYFLTLIHKSCEALGSAALAFTPTLPASLKGIRCPVEAESARRTANDCFNGLRDHLSAYVFNEYYPSLSSDFKADKAKLCDAILEAKAAVVGHVVARWNGAIEAKIAAVELERAQLARTVADRQQAHTHAQAMQCQAEQKLNAQLEAIERFAQDMDADIERGREFTGHLLQAFETELDERKRAIAAATTPPERLLELFGAVALCDEKDKLLSGHLHATFP
jgi:energy-coupling factor transporter ATP-binding protein EcfA2